MACSSAAWNVTCESAVPSLPILSIASGLSNIIANSSLLFFFFVFLFFLHRIPAIFLASTLAIVISVFRFFFPSITLGGGMELVSSAVVFPLIYTVH